MMQTRKARRATTSDRGADRGAPPLVPGLAAVLLLGLALTNVGCGAVDSSDEVADAIAPDPEHVADVEAWRAWRRGTLEQPDGWLSLVGLMWLDEGRNTFGADAGNDLVYAENGTPANVGTFIVDGETVRFEAAPGTEVRILDGDHPVSSMTVREPPVEGATAAPAPVLTWGSLRWHVIRRQDRFAIRLKDALSPVLVNFDGIEMFPIARDWRLDARFEFYDPVKPIVIPNILGTDGEGVSPGAVVFEVDGQTYRLDMWKDSDDPVNFFTAFGDGSNRVTTYGGGRFLWVDAPDEDGHTVVDFNRSYNPPCVFTPYATCPLPPEQNRLPLTIEAGEKTFKPATEAAGNDR